MLIDDAAKLAEELQGTLEFDPLYGWYVRYTDGCPNSHCYNDLRLLMRGALVHRVGYLFQRISDLARENNILYYQIK